MSLTSLLRAKGSPLRATFQELLPDTPAFLRRVNDDLVSSPLNTKKPEDSSLSGMALDYRLRYYFAITPPENTAAAHGAAGMAHGNEALASAFEERFGALHTSVLALNPVGRQLPDDDETTLAKYCIFLSYCEQFYRSGKSLLVDLALRTGELTEEPWRLAPPKTVSDVAAVSRSFFEHQYPLLASRPLVLNPTFAGSADVGGADADIIAGDSLIDFKSTIKARPVGGQDLYQLLGYACLDYTDEYRIRSVGLSVLRRDALREWDLEELTEAASGGKTSLPKLRARIQAVVGERAEFDVRLRRLRVKLNPSPVWAFLDERDISQNELARLIGISSGYLSQLMSGSAQPSPQVRRRLQHVLGETDFDSLFTITE